MFYVERNEAGGVIAIYKEDTGKNLESLEDNHPDILNFLQRSSDAEFAIKELQQSDIEMIRVVEDLIEILIEKNIIVFTDLPLATQTKILQRKKIREKLGEIL